MILHRYLLRESLPVLLLALLFLTAVYLFGFFYAGARWLEGVPLPKILRWLSYHVPGIWVQVFPIALVTTTVLVFGRLAAERGPLRPSFRRDPLGAGGAPPRGRGVGPERPRPLPPGVRGP